MKLAGWILIAVAIARGISKLASSLPASDAAQLLQLLFNSPRTAPGLIESLIAYTTSPEFLLTLALGFGGAILRAVAQWGQQVLATRGALGEKEHLRAQLVRHRLGASGSHADRAGEDTILATKGLDGLDDYYTDFLPALVSASIIPLGLGIWILLHDWVSALVLVLTIPLIPMFMILIGRFTENRVDEAAAGLNRLSQHLLELARGLPVLVGLRRAGMQRQALAEVSNRYQRTTMNTLKAAFMSGLALELISTLSVAIIAVFIGVRLVNGSMDLYAGIMVLTLAAEVYLPFRDIGSAYHASEDGIDALKRARAQIDQPHPQTFAQRLELPHHEVQYDHREDRSDDDAVTLRAVTIAYQALERVNTPSQSHPEYLTPAQYDRAKRAGDFEVDTPDAAPQYTRVTLDPVVTNFQLRLTPGTYHVLGDASGTGKSTILKALAGLLTEAEATFRGEVSGLVDRPVAYLSQHPNFASETVHEELELSNTGRTSLETVADIALRATGLSGYTSRRIDDLSPGERRRLGFARVLVRLMTADTKDRSWLVALDEPTAHLDSESAQRIRHVLRNLARGRLPNGPTQPVILLVASHDEQIHHDADRLYGNTIDTATTTAVSTAGHGGGTTAQLPQRESPATEDATLMDPSPNTDPASERVRLSDWLRFLPFRSGKFWAGIGWACAALLSGALLSALSGWLIVQASYEPPILYLLAVIVGVRFFGIGRAVFRYAERLAVHDAVLGWANRMRLRVWDALGSQAGQWNRLTRSGGALSVLISDVDQLRDAVPRVVVPIPAAILTWLISTGIIAFMAPGAWWPVFVAGILAFGVVPIIVHLVDARTSTALADHRSWLVNAVSRIFGSAADTAGNQLGGAVARRFEVADAATAAPVKRNSLASGIGDGLATLLSAWAAVQTLWVAMTHGISAPNTALVVMLALALAEPIGLFSQAAQESRTLRHQLVKLLPLLKQDHNAASQWVDVTASDDALSALHLDKVTVSYGSDAPTVLDELTLTARKGDFVVVTGPSGSGKSTLLAVLLGFLKPQSGKYQLASVKQRPADALQHVAWCPQEAHLFDSTLRSNLALARDPAQRPTDEELYEVLDTVGLTAWLKTTPDGLDTRLGPSGHFISGGQRQRVAVARALLADAHVVLLDEPTAHLGADEAEALITDLQHALRNKIVIMVTHDQRFDNLPNGVRLHP